MTDEFIDKKIPNNPNDKKAKILVIAGPTAVGKTKFAIAAAKKFDGEIVSCDSMQIYKYMDIGSAKPTKEESGQAVHHLVDFVDPRDDFSVARYRDLAIASIKNILRRKKLPIVSGGTGLYLNSILYDMDFADTGCDPEYRSYLKDLATENGSTYLYDMLLEKAPGAALKIHPNNTKKIIRALERLHNNDDLKPFNELKRENEYYDAVLVGLKRDRKELYDRINKRVLKLIDSGLEEEVRKLIDMGLTENNISMKGIGYKEIINYLGGACELEEAVAKIQQNTRRYAKRQLTWLRRYDKMFWLNISDYNNDDDALEALMEWLKINL